MSRRTAWFVVVGMMALAMSGCDSSQESQDSGGGPPPSSGSSRPAGYVSRADMGKQWPFTVEDGVLGCDGSALTFTSGGVTYGVNGTALTLKKGVRMDPIWASDPTIEGAKINIGPLMDKARDTCK